MELRKKLLTLVLVALALAVVNASVFTYYPLSITLTPQKPPLIFKYGSNTKKPDLYGETITADIGPANTSLSLTVHPTYQKTYYKDIAEIKNQDSSNSYYVAIRVNTPFSGPTEAELLVFSGSTNVAAVDLLSTGTTAWLGPIPANGVWSIDLKVVILEKTGDSSSSAPSISQPTASVQLIYSPQNTESPP
ncbi:MAG: hypothetical protein ACPLN2_05825 [Thermoproteota archaeon]